VPIIAFGRGGALETVVGLDDAAKRAPTGVFFHDQTVEGLIEAVETFEANTAAFDPHAIRRNALRFDRPLFKQALRDILLRERPDLVLAPADRTAA
jgi:hypothetical protein